MPMSAMGGKWRLGGLAKRHGHRRQRLRERVQHRVKGAGGEESAKPMVQQNCSMLPFWPLRTCRRSKASGRGRKRRKAGICWR